MGHGPSVEPKSNGKKMTCLIAAERLIEGGGAVFWGGEKNQLE